MPTRVIRTIGEWEAERAAWEEIYTSGHHTPFQRYEWLSGWWAYAGAGKLHIIEVDDDAGRALGFAPFFLRKRYYGWPLPHLAFIGTKRADYLDFLVRDGAEAVFFRELFHALQRADRPLVLVDLRDVPESSANIPWVEREAGRQAWFCVTDRCTVCVACRLPADWRTFLRSLSVRNQRHVRYDRRNLARRCTAILRDCRAPQDVQQGFRDMVRIYRERWAGSTDATRFADDAAVEFEAALYLNAAERGALRLWLLDVDGEPAACVSGFVHGRTLMIDTVAHAPAYREYSVGNVLIGHVIEASIAEGFAEVDLTRGPEQYKYAWGGEERRNVHLRLCRSYTTIVRAIRAEQTYLTAARSSTLRRTLALARRVRAAGIMALFSGAALIS